MKHEERRCEGMDKLVKAIKRHSGLTTKEIIQAGEHGADAGWAGFTYYKDTVKFYDRNADAIWDLLEERASDLGEKHQLALVASFKSAGTVFSDRSFKNLLARFTLEEAGQYLANKKEQA